MESFPVQLQEWANAHEPKETLIYARGYWDQIMFVRDNIPQLLAENEKEYEAICANLMVISTHVSKSVCLPVFQLTLVDGTMFTMRYNFYDWKISISSPRDVNMEFMGLFDPKKRISSCYCEGFPEELVYGPYSKNKHKFTIEIYNQYYLFVFFWIFSRQVLKIRT